MNLELIELQGLLSIASLDDIVSLLFSNSELEIFDNIFLNIGRIYISLQNATLVGKQEDLSELDRKGPVYQLLSFVVKAKM